LLALLALVVAGAGAVGWLLWRRGPEAPPLAPPHVPLDNVERPVAEAIQRALQNVSEQPRSAHAWGFLGQLLLANAFETQALVCLREAERLDPNDLRWPYLCGVHLRTRDPDAALICLRRAVELCSRDDPEQAPRVQLAEALLEAGNYNEAEAVLQTLAGRRYSEEPRYRFARARLALLCGHDQEAVKGLSGLIKEPHARQQACALLARAYHRLKNEGAAARFGQRARELPDDAPWPDPYQEEVWQLRMSTQSQILRAEDLFTKGKDREALALFGELASAEDGGELAQLSMAARLLQRQQFALAERALRQVLARGKSGQLRGYFLLSLVLYSQAEKLREGPPGEKDRAHKVYQEAVAAARRATELQPSHAPSHLCLGRALLRLGPEHDREALAALRRAVECRPESPLIHVALGEALAQTGNLKEALDHLEEAVRCAGADDPGPAQVLERFRKQHGGKQK
jgi:tetratricopeptide (TPR) repeat protein